MLLEVTYISEANKQQQRDRQLGETKKNDFKMASHAAFLKWFACNGGP